MQSTSRILVKIPQSYATESDSPTEEKEEKITISIHPTPLTQPDECNSEVSTITYTKDVTKRLILALATQLHERIQQKALTQRNCFFDSEEYTNPLTTLLRKISHDLGLSGDGIIKWSIYLNRYCQIQSNDSLHPHNVQRVLIASAIITYDYWEGFDNHYDYIPSICNRFNITPVRIRELQMTFLKALNFKLMIDEEEFLKHHHQLSTINIDNLLQQEERAALEKKRNAKQPKKKSKCACSCIIM